MPQRTPSSCCDTDEQMKLRGLPAKKDRHCWGKISSSTHVASKKKTNGSLLNISRTRSYTCVSLSIWYVSRLWRCSYLWLLNFVLLTDEPVACHRDYIIPWPSPGFRPRKRKGQSTNIITWSELITSQALEAENKLKKTDLSHSFTIDHIQSVYHKLPVLFSAAVNEKKVVLFSYIIPTIASGQGFSRLWKFTYSWQLLAQPKQWLK